MVKYELTNFETSIPITQSFSEQVLMSCEQIEHFCPGIEAYQTEQIVLFSEETILKYPEVEALMPVVIALEFQDQIELKYPIVESLSIQIEEFCPVVDEYELKYPVVDSMMPEVISYELQD